MVVGSWSKARALGRGSTATVWLATSPSYPVPFAVKSSAAGLSCSSLLQREKRILSSLSSPYVVSYLGFEASVDYSEFNLFMEYAAGGSLADEIKAKGRLIMDNDESLIRSRARDVVHGLTYLHGIGLVHCDVKATNVLIGSDNRAMLGDFGCAKWELDEQWDKSVRGTPLFMAPEVARGDKQGTEADIWALGCTVIEMATGRPPWPDFVDPIAAVHEIAFGNSVPEVPCWISEEGKDFLDKCLKRDPKQRWTADQLLMHPFVTADFSSVKLSNWVSPKTVLDQDIWDSMTEDEEEDECIQDFHYAFERISQLATRETNASSDQFIDWAWEENSGWITVRSSDTNSSVNSEEEAERILILANENGFSDASLIASVSSSSRTTTKQRSAEFTSREDQHLLQPEEFWFQDSYSSNSSTNGFVDSPQTVESENFIWLCKDFSDNYHFHCNVKSKHHSNDNNNKFCATTVYCFCFWFSTLLFSVSFCSYF